MVDAHELKNKAIRLKKVNDENFIDLMALDVAEQQQDFVASNTVSMAQAYATFASGRFVQCFGIYDGDTAVGFAMIGHRSEEYEGMAEVYRHSYYLWRFMIDKRYQGKGYGKESLQLALDFIRSAPCRKADYAWLCYAPENKVAKSLYASFGFEEVPEAYDPEDDEILAVLKL